MKDAIKLYTILVIIAAIIFIPAIIWFGSNSTSPTPHVVSAQQSNTIYKQMGTGITSVPFTSANVPTIGQSYHLMYVFFHQIPGRSCVTTSVDGLFEASFDNFATAGFPLTAGRVNTNGLGTTSQATLTAIGLAPYVRLVINTFDTTNCTMDIFYSGSLYPTYVSKMENTRLEGGYNILPFNQTNAGTFVGVPAGVSGLFISPSVAIYGLQCSNNAAQQISIGTGVVIMMPASGQITWPPTGLPYIMTNQGSGLSINLSTATLTSCLIQYRYEN